MVKFLFHLKSPRSFLEIFLCNNSKIDSNLYKQNKINPKGLMKIPLKCFIQNLQKYQSRFFIFQKLLIYLHKKDNMKAPPVLTKKANIKPVPRDVSYFQ